MSVFSSPAHAVHHTNSSFHTFCFLSVQIDKIMSSIGAGIGSGLDIKEDISGKDQRTMSGTE